MTSQDDSTQGPQPQPAPPAQQQGTGVQPLVTSFLVSSQPLKLMVSVHMMPLPLPLLLLLLLPLTDSLTSLPELLAPPASGSGAAAAGR
jgi:hypothetical protein